jgi:hypothetical protein
MKPLINTKPGIRALQEMVDTIQYYPPGVLLFEAEEPKTMLIKGEVPMLVSWTSTGKRVGKRRGLKKQQELWLQQMAAMKETGVTFRPELADK